MTATHQVSGLSREECTSLLTTAKLSIYFFQRRLVLTGSKFAVDTKPCATPTQTAVATQVSDAMMSLMYGLAATRITKKSLTLVTPLVTSEGFFEDTIIEALSSHLRVNSILPEFSCPLANELHQKVARGPLGTDIWEVKAGEKKSLYLQTLKFQSKKTLKNGLLLGKDS